MRTSRLAEELNFARLDGSLTKLRTKIVRLDLLILDDFALLPMGPQEFAVRVLISSPGQAPPSPHGRARPGSYDDLNGGVSVLSKHDLRRDRRHL